MVRIENILDVNKKKVSERINSRETWNLSKKTISNDVYLNLFQCVI